MKPRFYFLLLSLFCLFFSPQTALAVEPKLPVRDESYRAKFVGQSLPDSITLPAGTTKTIIFRFKNTGTATWNETGKNYISAYTVEPKYRDSEFRGSGWISKQQTGKIKGTIKPGVVGELAIEFKAPATDGEYIERFYLSSENHTWVKGGYFFVKMKVGSATDKLSQNNPETETKKVTEAPVSSQSLSESSVLKKETQPAVPQQTQSMIAIPYLAKFLGLSIPKLTLAPGERVSILFMYQNVGTKPWTSFSFKGNEGVALAGQSISFADESWKSPTLVRGGSVNVARDGLLQKNFTLKAPQELGSYQAAFYLEVDGQKVEGSDAMVDVTVMTNASQSGGEPLPLPSVTPQITPRLNEEPKIRVGLQKLDKEITFFALQDEYEVSNGTQVVNRLPINASATFSYTTGTYTCICNGKFLTSTEFFRVTPVNNLHAVFELRNFARTMPWQKGVNFHTYHGAFEYRIPKNGFQPYAINELFFEDYVAGIRETSNGTPMEYMKSQTVLQRTYAYYIKEHTDKHVDRYFDVVAHTGDQLYLGYESEKLMPRFLEAVAATRGLMVVYDTDKNPATSPDIVITPYFGNTDGWTRSWKEVWGGKDDKPWLVSVPAIYDKRDRKGIYGHGVGMSQRDAMIKASEEKLGFEALIQYYYTGVEIERIY